jgi:hypothetical protein
LTLDPFHDLGLGKKNKILRPWANNWKALTLSMTWVSEKIYIYMQKRWALGKKALT